jgi:fluoride ion exporter CrcB/FEX
MLSSSSIYRMESRDHHQYDEAWLLVSVAFLSGIFGYEVRYMLSPLRVYQVYSSLPSLSVDSIGSDFLALAIVLSRTMAYTFTAVTDGLSQVITTTSSCCYWSAALLLVNNTVPYLYKLSAHFLHKQWMGEDNNMFRQYISTASIEVVKRSSFDAYH